MGGMAYRKRFGSALLSAASLLALTATGPALAEAPPPLEEAEAPDMSRPSDADTISVTGVRIPPAGDWSSLPSLVVTSEDIALSRGFALEDILNRTPLFAPDQTGTSNLGGEGVSTLNLRALNAASGAPRTLVLLNGRRYAASDEFGRVDVAALPASLVRRIDVVTGGASAAHGADAIAGAVNFILDKEFEGADVRLRYGVTDEADGEEASVSAAFGAPIAGGRGHATLFADYYDRNAVEASERRFASVPLDDQGGGAGFQPFGSSRIPGGLAVGGGRPPIPDPLGRDLNGDGAVDLFPSGLAFEDGAIAPAAGFAPDGAPNPLPSLYNFQDLNYLQIPAERLSVFAMGDFDLSSALTVYGEASFADVRNTQRLAEDANDIPEAGVLSVPLSNPLIADNAVLVDFLQTNYDNGLAGDALAGDGVATIADFRRRMTETGPRRTERDIETTRIVVGGEGELGPAQTIAYDIYYSFSQVNRQDVIEGVTSDRRIQQALFAETDPVTGDVVCVDRSNGCAPLSLFGDGAISADAAQFISPLAEERLRTRQHIVSGVVTAPLDFGGESVTPVVALGAEYRKESAEFRPNEVLQSGELGPGATRGETDGDYDVWSLFSEFRAPIEVGAPLLRSVEVDGSVRVETYSTVGGVLSFGGGAVWTLTDSFQFRTR
ncbi:MAG: TonB-dependent receptor plug domain-containing protein, partial [Pseudomonadota bacterium]